MATLTISNKTLDKYFSFLKNLDTKSKKLLIDKLTKSMKKETNKPFSISSVFGSWEDKRTAEEIITEIRGSRIEKQPSVNL